MVLSHPCVRLCGSPLTTFELTDLNETWYEYNSTRGHTTVTLFNFLPGAGVAQSV
jgi:hypothetical protein